MEENLQNYQGANSPVLNQVINKTAGDMSFVGIMYIIIGAFYCLTIIGALIGVPFIIAGIRIRESAEQFRYYIQNNDILTLQNAIEKQGKHFFILKVLFIVSIVLMVLYFIFIFAFMGTIMSGLDVNNL